MTYVVCNTTQRKVWCVWDIHACTLREYYLKAYSRFIAERGSPAKSPRHKVWSVWGTPWQFCKQPLSRINCSVACKIITAHLLNGATATSHRLLYRRLIYKPCCTIGRVKVYLCKTEFISINLFKINKKFGD